MQTLVIGHKNPDMDSICSAIAYAELKVRTGFQNIVAARAGNTNARIDYVLQKFGYEPPHFFSSVAPRVEDVMERNVVLARADEPVYEAVTRMGEHGFRGLPVVENGNRFIGLLSGLRLGRYLFPAKTETHRAREVRTSLASVLQTIDGKVILGTVSSEEQTLILTVGAMDSHTFAHRLSQLDTSRLVLLVGDRENIIELALKAGTLAIVVTGALAVSEHVREIAAQSGTLLISSPYDTATTVLLARGAVLSRNLLEENHHAFGPDKLLDEVREAIGSSSNFLFPVLDEQQHLVGIFSKSDLLKPPARQLILVDHNEPDQAVEGAETVPILEIIDHHRIDTVVTDQPILFINQPVGSTCTIVTKLFRQAAVDIPQKLAGVLMAGLISDTLNLTSPTTTLTDKEVMRHLESRALIEPNKLAEQIFEVGSPLRTLSADEAVNLDCKDYEEAGRRFRIGQIEELSFSRLPEKQDRLLEALEDMRAEHMLFFAALLVTDINTQDSVLLVAGDEKFLKTIHYPPHGTQAWKLDGVVSRKKQLLPYLISCLRKAG